MNLPYGGEAADWVVRGGRPARVLGSRMMPSYEHEDGKIMIMEFLVIQRTGLSAMAFPISYGWVSMVAPEGPVPLHLAMNGAHEWWAWRPVIHRWHIDGWWQALGSQQELAYRFGLNEVQHELHGDNGDVAQIMRGEARAEALMLTQLSYQQRLEFAAKGNFRVLGARTGNLYQVIPGDGFNLIDAHTGDVIISFCLHTEHWLPMCDQALAVKMALEDPELEGEVLAGAKPYPRSKRRRVRMSDRVALRLEREHRLLPKHRELEVA